ncbi:MAG: hypothetical protein IJ316_05535 [Clostridia bacterium]|nr:hypothetical protein [Clostridia bacterium]
MKKFFLCLVLAVVLVFSLAACSNEAENSAAENSSAANSAVQGAVKTGDIITLGSYEQDGDASNGKEEIEWLVLDIKDDQAFVISKYALDCKPYHEELVEITWENCTLRGWLNDEFYNNAFNDEEQNKIIGATIINADNPGHGTDGGNDTEDKVFLLSLDEVNAYFSSDSERMAVPTAYAVGNNAYQSTNCLVDGIGSTAWWLRSPASSSFWAAVVTISGGDGGSAKVDDIIYAVRPAMWINLVK